MKCNTIETFVNKIKSFRKVMLVVLLALFCVIPVSAYAIDANEVGYTPADENWDVENVSEALDGLYLMTIEYKCLESLEEANGTAITPTDTTLGSTFNPLITEYDMVLDTFAYSFTLQGDTYEE